MLKTMIRVGDKLPTHPASIKIKFESKLISPLNSRRGGAISFRMTQARQL